LGTPFSPGKLNRTDFSPAVDFVDKVFKFCTPLTVGLLVFIADDIVIEEAGFGLEIDARRLKDFSDLLTTPIDPVADELEFVMKFISSLLLFIELVVSCEGGTSDEICCD
jgi:hypothetical protein